MSFEQLNRWSAIRLIGGFLYGLMWLQLSGALSYHYGAR